MPNEIDNFNVNRDVATKCGFYASSVHHTCMNPDTIDWFEFLFSCWYRKSFDFNLEHITEQTLVCI